ncbi:hypothetical protein [Amnibacterium kyonggiense]|uniref:Uncharacterized protein n=1 Tax=Amnibacterium kyonggiense TaxID=595671 RepID=A0A4R7FKE6_9MICO|nr:hypothetical protein [Amnibacterium kyonggiense]TDS76841.1 hypothetical protein CLV52_1779 [Amnibacterium kyonggiense]
MSTSSTAPAPVRVALALVAGAVALTAVAGGAALVVGTLTAGPSVLVPPTRYLAGSPFDSYLVPGLVLAVVVGGSHALAAVLAARRSRWALVAATVAAFGLLVWIFVQTALIPFSVLQAVYEAAAIAELGLVLLALGLLTVRRRSSSRPGHASPV